MTIPTYDLTISGSNCSINCWCQRWDIDNYSSVLETHMNKSNLQALRNSIRPGATGELFTILGRPHYCDKSWTKANTLRIIPHPSMQVSYMRNEFLGYVRNCSDTPMGAETGKLNVKLEFYVSGNDLI